MPNIINQLNNNVNSKGLRIVFLGTPEFAVPILEKLAQGEFKPAAVFCAPDKPVGREQILTPPPVKVAAQKYNMPVYQPADVQNLKSSILGLKSDLIVSAAFGIILPKEVLDAPKFGCLNIHPSLLPKYRGPSPIQAAILNGDAETGVTIIKMTEKVDAGPIIVNCKFKIENLKYTTPELSQILADLSAQLLIEILPGWLTDKIKPQPQNESQASYTKIIKKQDGQIDWQKSAKYIECQTRAFTPWPGAYTRIKNYELRIMNLKILEAEASNNNKNKNAGQIFLNENKELVVQAGEGTLIVKKLQTEGGKPMDAQDFLRGHRDVVDLIFI